jgi:hypothetical protein
LARTTVIMSLNTRSAAAIAAALFRPATPRVAAAAGAPLSLPAASVVIQQASAQGAPAGGHAVTSYVATGKNPLRSLKPPVCNKPWYCPQISIVPCTRTIVYHTLMHRGCRTIATDVAPPSPASARARAARVATAAAPPSQGAPVIPAAARALAGVHTTAAPPVMPAHLGQHIVG